MGSWRAKAELVFKKKRGTWWYGRIPHYNLVSFSVGSLNHANVKRNPNHTPGFVSLLVLSWKLWIPLCLPVAPISSTAIASQQIWVSSIQKLMFLLYLCQVCGKITKCNASSKNWNCIEDSKSAALLKAASSIVLKDTQQTMPRCAKFSADNSLGITL